MENISILSVVCFFTALIIAQWMYHHELFVPLTTGGNHGGRRTELHHEIVIGILSARENSAQRQAIRETWAQHIQDQSALRDKLLVRFIIGNKGCDIPYEFREDSHSCKSVLINTSMVNIRKEMVAFNFKKPSSRSCGEVRRFYGEYYGMDFSVHYALVLKRLGLYDTGSLSHQPTVTLYDTWRQEPVISVAFTPDDPGILQDGYRYKDVETYLFPKNFEGTIVVGPLGGDNSLLSGIKANQSESHMQNTNNILSVKSFLRTAKTATFPTEIGLQNLPFSPGNFIFEIHQPEEVEKMLNSTSVATQSNIEKNRKESQALVDELQQHNDLLLVDQVDVYRNIPQKLLHFCRWVINNTRANFIIKTDDDCFMNVEQIMEVLKEGHITANSRSWWGSFRTNWPLDILGKWAEHEYSSPVYPAFACGSGNLLTRDLVQWISQNTQFLHTYQGEDVSMGIWLASILPTYIDDRRWQCDNTCHKDVLVLPEQSPQQLRLLWHNWVLCQNLCGC